MKRILSVFCVVLLCGCQSFADFPRTLDQVSAREPSQRQLSPETWRTEDGSRVLFMHTDALPMLDVRLTFAAGSSRDGEHPGLAGLTSALVGEGAEGLSVDDIARGFENLGAQFSASSYRDMGVIELRTLSDSPWLDDSVELFRRLIATPTFPADALARKRAQRMQGLRMDQQVPGPQVGKAYNRVLFGDHPYGHPASGTLESLPGITVEQIREFWNEYYNSSNLVIAMVGDISRERAGELAERLSGALPQGEPASALPRAEPLAEHRRRHIEFDSSQTHIYIGEQMIWRGHPDYIPLYVGNHILGGSGFSSILTDEVRQKRGYVYSISSSLSPMAAAGPFTVGLQTGNDTADEALDLTLSLVSDFVREGPDAEQVARARDTIIGSFALSTAANSDIVGQLAAIGFYDLPLDYLNWFQKQVNGVSAEDVKQAFQKHLDPDRLAIVSIGPQAPGDDDDAGE